MQPIIRFLQINFLWILFFGFAIVAILTKHDEGIFFSEGPYGGGKILFWGIFFSFLAYSIYSSTKENFYKTVAKISSMYWGRQIGIDLYIGLMLPLVIIYFHGGLLILMLWLLPVLMYANLATLLYLSLNYDSIIAQFL